MIAIASTNQSYDSYEWYIGVMVYSLTLYIHEFSFMEVVYMSFLGKKTVGGDTHNTFFN